MPPRRRKRVIISREMGTLEGRIAVVTGGTAGVGRGIASELANCGAQVFVTGHSIQDCEPDDSRITNGLPSRTSILTCAWPKPVNRRINDLQGHGNQPKFVT
jgi:hypothetical protein